MPGGESPLLIAVARGRVLSEALPLLKRAGIGCEPGIETSRKLVFDTDRPWLRLVVLRGVDVSVYVSKGAAQLGILGSDLLLENPLDNLYEPLDLGTARCRLMVAAPIGAVEPSGRLRVATKYVNLSRRYFATLGRQVEIIKLNGSVEIAPAMGLSDVVVDIVDSGRTLTANGLETRELIADISSRLVINKAAMKTDYRRIAPLLRELERALARDD